MKKIFTLMLAAGMLLGAASGAKAIDFKASGEWLVGFGLGDGSLIKDVDNKKRHHEDTFSAGQRVRLQLDAVASESLSGTVYFEIGDTTWGQNSSGGALGADSNSVVELKNAYIDWMVPNTDLKFRMGIQNIAMPNVAGGNLSIFNYIETGSIVHQISLNGGILAGSHHPSVQDLGISGPYTASLRSTYIPMMAGYTLNLPIGDYTMFYLGGKVGATYGDVKTTIHGLEDGSRSRTISSTKFSWAAQAGFKFSISNSADFVLGYEYYQIQGYNDPGYHTIKLGFSWNF